MFFVDKNRAYLNNIGDRKAEDCSAGIEKDSEININNNDFQKFSKDSFRKRMGIIIKISHHEL